MKKISIIIIIAFAIFMTVFPSSLVLAASGLKIGVTKVKITPEEPTILGGYSHGTDALCNPATDILDDIYCRILVAEDGLGNREVFLSMDVCVYMENDFYDTYNGTNVYWPKTVPAGTTQRFANVGGVDISKVFVSATHTHQASEQLAEKYIQRIADGITTAINNMVAVNVGYINTVYDINVNRRPDFGVHPNLECDKSILVAVFRNASTNAPVASIVNYAIHNTGIGIGGNGYFKCSSELTGIAMNKIESNYGGDFVALFIQGHMGDIGPNCHGSGGATYDTVVSIGNTFGQDCTNILNGISVNDNPVSVNGLISSQTLATKAGWGVPSEGINFAAARIGDICFIGGSGEIFNQMGVSLRLQSPFGATITASLVNGYSGYVPTISGFYDGVVGPEVTTKTPWTPTIENTYMTEMSKLVSSIAGGTGQLGYSSVGGNSENAVANVLTVSKCNAGSNMTIDTLKIYVQNATGKVRMGLYADNGTDSPSLIQQTDEIILVNGWNKGAIPSTNIVPGTYWIGFVFSNSGNSVYYDLRKLGSYSQSYTYGSMPSNPTGMSWGKGMYSVYAGNRGTTVELKNVTVSPIYTTITVYGTQQLAATISPSNAAIKTVNWSSGNTSVATVNSSGLVTAVAAGSTIITATAQDGGKIATCAVTVNASESTIGLNTIGGITEQGDSGYWIANNFTAVSNTTVNRMNLYVTNASGNARLGIYSDSSGKPGTLLAQTDEIPLSNGWNGGTLGTIQNLTAGVTYWLVIEVNSSATTLYYNSSGITKYKSMTYGMLPSTAPSGLSSGTGTYSVYADYNGVVGSILNVSVAPTTATISVNATQQLAATISPPNSPNNTVSWISDNTAVATVSSAGLVTAVAVGSANITVTTQDGNKSATSVITVNEDNGSVFGLNTIGGISETGDSGYWIANSFTAVSNTTVNSMNFYVTSASGNARLGIYSDIAGVPGTLLAQTGEIKLSNGWNSGTLGAIQNLTAGLTYWLAIEVNSSATTLYYNSATGKLRYKSYTYGALPTAAPSGLTSGSGIYSIYADYKSGTIIPVTGVSVNPNAATILTNATQQLTATVLPSNATNNIVSWSSNNTSVATVSSTGLVTALTAGIATITVTTQDGNKTTTCIITVNGGNGSVFGLNIIGGISETGDSGYWIANNFTAVSNTTVNRMNLYVTNASGNTRLGIYSDSSGKPGILLAQTDEIPLSNGWNSGTLGSIQYLTAGLTYWLAIEVNSSATTLYYNPVGITRYKSMAYGILPSTAPSGLSSGSGTYSIYADYNDVSGSILVTDVSVTPSSATISVNGTQQLTATVLPSNATNKTVNWSSDNTAVATVSGTGLVTALAAGSATITLTTQDGNKTATSLITVNVDNGLVFGLNTIGGILETGDSGYWIANNFTAVSNTIVNSINLYVTSASGNARFGIYSDSSGKPGTLLAQTDEIPLSNGWNSGTLGSIQYLTAGLTYWLAIEVNSSATTLYYNPVGITRYKSMSYAALPSSAPSGLSSGTGTYSIYADYKGGTIIPVTGVSVNPNAATILTNATQQLTATVLPSNATNNIVSWSSNNTSVATVSSTGLVTALTAGIATITVTTQDGNKTTTCIITVNGGNGSVFGLNIIGGISETGDSGYWIANNFTAVSNTTVNRMNLYVTNASGNTRLGIYSDSSGKPGILLAQTDEIPLSNGWNSGTLGSIQYLTAGLTYWLAIEVNSSATTLYYNPVGITRYKSMAYGILPSTAPSGLSSGTGTYSIYADYNGVPVIPVTGVSVNPASVSLNINATQLLTATVSPSDATNKTVNWISDNTAVATVSSTGLVTALTAGTATITVTTQDGNKTATCLVTVNVPVIPVTGVSVNPASVSLNINATQLLTATVSPSDATNKTVNWISDNTAVATVSSTGLVTALTAGTATITVTTQDGNKTATCLVTVNVPVIPVTGVSVNPASVSLNINATQLLTATVSPSDANNKTVNWISDNTAVATVSSTGLVTALTAGTATITVTTQDGNKTATCLVTVNVPVIPVTGVSVNPASVSLNINATQLLTATVSPSDANNKTVNWISDNTAVATVSSTGLVTALTAGTATITVTTQDGNKTATCLVTVNVPVIPVTGVSVNPASVSLNINATQLLTATVSPSDANNKTVNWISDNTAVATVSSTGLVTALTAGTATITVTTQDGNKTATCLVTVNVPVIPVTGVSVNPASVSLNINATQLLTATVSPSDANNKTVNWISDNTAVATVSSTGLVTALTAGTATITVTTQDGNKTATCLVTVNVPVIPVTGVSVNPASVSLNINATQLLTATVSPSDATNKTVNWISDNTAVATVSSTGLVTALTAGTATITVTTQDGNKTATCLVTVNVPVISVTGVSVNPASVSLNINATQLLTATVSPSDATNKTVNWISDNTAVATVSSTGLVTALTAGTATITVTTQDGNKTATCLVTVNVPVIPVTGVSVNPASVSLNINATQLLTATVSPSDATNKTVNWISDNTAVATVSSTGLVTALTAGTATITVTTQDGNKTATCLVTVNVPVIPVTGVSVNPASVSLNINATQLLTATVSPSDATNKTVNWISDNTAVATVSSTGLVTALTAGTATITVTTQDGNKTATCLVTVNVPVIPVTGVSVNPASVSLNINATQLLTATVSPSDANNKTVNWISDNTAVATVSSTGLVTALTAGTATITVTTQDGNKTATCLVTVNVPVIPVTGVSVNPASVSLNINATQLLTATVSPSDATNKTVNWISDNTAVATASSTGLVTALTAGTATITVTTQDGNKTATCLVTVNVPVISVTGVSVNPASVSLNINATQLLTATVSPSDATNKTVNWISDNTAVATASSTGLVTALTAGTATITVTTQDGNKTATCLVTVNVPVISVTGVSVNPASVSLNINATQLLTATVSPSDATNKTVNWISDNTAVATVSSTGLVTALTAGTATITVTTQDGNKTATCLVTVNAPVIPDHLKVAFFNDNISKIITLNDIQNKLMIYPNPVTKGVLYINLSSGNESTIINIFDLTGRLIYNGTFMSGNRTQQLDISNLNRGIYLIKIVQRNSNYISKLIVESN